MPPDRGPDAGPGPEVVGFDRTAAGLAGLDRLVDLARRTLVAEGVTGGRLDLIAVDPTEMADLNATHMGHEGPTDVLAFPLDAPPDGPTIDDPGDPSGTPIHLGDVVVCPDVASDQAPAGEGGADAELALLVVHGVLHVLGHDHAEPGERAVMEARERHHLAAAGIGHPAR